MKSILNLFKDKKARNWVMAIVAMVVLALVSLGFLSAGNSNAAAATEAKVSSLDVAEMIEASGSLEAQPFARLDWKTSGVVESVNIQAGDFVKAGDVLVTLQPSSTSANIVSAQADLLTAQKDLDDLLYSNIDLAQTVVDVKDAQEAYDDAVSYLEYLQNDKKIYQSETRVILQQTRRGYQYVYKTKEFKGPAPEDWLVEAENDLDLKKAQLEELQRTFDRLKDGPNASEVLAAQAKVDAAQATVNQLSIIAPFDGQILSVDNLVGDSVDTGELSVNLADMDHLYVETQVDESDIAAVKLGNQAEVTLDAVPGVTLTGNVSAINPVGEIVSGLVKYSVRVDLDKVKDGAFLPLGTTANVVIQIKASSAMLAVPIAAIQNDTNGEYLLLIQSDNTTKRVSVVSGSIVGDVVAVTGDVKEGDRLQLIDDGGFQAPNPFGGGN
jgi:HlyD family secretion protein